MSDAVKNAAKSRNDSRYRGKGRHWATPPELFAKLDEDDLVVHEIATGDVRDDFWISLRGPMKMQAEALQRAGVAHYAAAPGDLAAFGFAIGEQHGPARHVHAFLIQGVR